MHSLSSADIALLSSELPMPVHVEIESTLYASGRGQIELRMAGALDAPPVMLLHGIGSSSDGYRAQLAGLSDHYRVIAWNAPGFGASTPLGTDKPEVNHYAQILARLLDTLQIERLAALVGSSWGSVIAVTFAALYPERLRSLVLSAPNTARGRLVGKEREAALAALIAAGSTSQPLDRKAVAARLLPSDAAQEVRDLVEQLRDAVTPVGWEQAAHMLFSVHTPSMIGQVRCPIGLLVGSMDMVAPPENHAALLGEAAPSAELQVFEGCGHMLKLEAPTKFNDAVRRLAMFAG